MSTSKYLFDDEIFYPSGDGKPMADNTLQYEWIVTIKEGLDLERPNDFVAADLFWYPVEGKPKIVQAPDVMVAFNRPKGHRLSYKQWKEGNVAPQIVFEILSNSNTPNEMLKKLDYYSLYGVKEYYVFDPDKEELLVYTRDSESLKQMEFVGGWVSPLLGIRFQFIDRKLKIFHTDGEPFLSFPELQALFAQERQEKALAIAKAEEATAKAEEARIKAEEATTKAKEAVAIAEQERLEKEKLREKLKSLGIDPDSI
ncbi:MAG: Uma2 family endonuclease [Acidobacteria bacterium]|nr:Uma2 family endonuclease [Acidobacteriota bacterium]